MNWFQTILKFFAGFIIIAVIALGIFFYFAKKSAEKKSHMIDELAKVPMGSTVEDVMKLAQKLGFDLYNNEFAIPSVVEMTNEDSQKYKYHLPEKVQKDTDLSKFKNGRINFGLSLFLLERKGCEVVFKEGRATSARIWSLD